MPLDAICISAVRKELSGQITGMKIDKVQQPERDVVILSLRGGAEPGRLLISAGSGDMRVHMTEHRFDNPASPPMFCMLLRKHLTGARIVAVNQPPFERVVELVLDAVDAIGIASEKRLVIELIGRLSNIILVDGDGLIIDCLRRTGGEMSDKRSVLPGLIYRAPPPQEGKAAPQGISGDEWRKIFDSAREATADKWMQAAFSALSPLICRELSWRSYGDAAFRMDAITDNGDALRREFFSLMELVATERFEPWTVVGADNTPRDFSYCDIRQYEAAASARREGSFSAMLDAYYTQTAQIARARQRGSAAAKTIKNARDRLVRKLIAQNAELEKAAQRDSLRECGDLITANLHLIKKGQSVFAAEDFYSESGGTREIALDPLKTPQQNAAKYYKAYSKAKTAEKYLAEQIKLAESELEYLESVLGELALAESERDVNEIRGELVSTGYIRERKAQKVKRAESEPLRFESTAGLRITVGRNNIQNDKLTLKTAARSDVWLHAQKIHGAHVIISCDGKEPDERSLHEAAALAVYYSSARSGGKTPVDHTLVKHVKKPPGGRPGMVIYTDFKTVIASPDEELVERLRV